MLWGSILGLVALHCKLSEQKQVYAALSANQVRGRNQIVLYFDHGMRGHQTKQKKTLAFVPKISN